MEGDARKPSRSSGTKRARKSPADPPGPTGDTEQSEFMVDVYSVFMCKECHFVLAEGRSASEFNDMLDVIACLKATRNVKRDVEVSYQETLHCFYNILNCKKCSNKVGVFLVSAAADLAHLRDMFCFSRTAIVCYSMTTKRLIEGSHINVDVSQCVAVLDELEHKVMETYESLRALTKAMKDCLSPGSDEG